MYEQTLELLQKHKGHFREISRATGLDYDWLHQVSRGVIKDPGVKKIETLHSHLTSLEDEDAA